MIDFYSYGTFNGKAVAIALEELDIEYNVVVVDLMQGAQKQPKFLRLNPSGRIPVIVDLSITPPIVVSQTGTILIYLAEKSRQLLPDEPRIKAQVLEWLLFQLTDISTNVFNHFFLKCLVSPKHPEAATVLQQRAIDFYQLFERQLADQQYLVGEQLSIADIAAFPVVDALKVYLLNERFPNVKQWFDMLSERESFKVGMNHAQ
ncbi:glutathione S-transferase family protein [Marinicella litoralis]|uniref:GST-like protein n=1 Tax=Marinicella litoralis TaxID=644220 RepID=A0A4R6XJE8_9GAMM|nr:glutathione S-transferase family protein [Marinicella litoralis]TDR17547.1 GST-like protein [Marinicella litoralis]